jgi:hypothetical protein
MRRRVVGLTLVSILDEKVNDVSSRNVMESQE